MQPQLYMLHGVQLSVAPVSLASDYHYRQSENQVTLALPPGHAAECLHITQELIRRGFTPLPEFERTNALHWLEFRGPLEANRLTAFEMANGALLLMDDIEPAHPLVTPAAAASAAASAAQARRWFPDSLKLSLSRQWRHKSQDVLTF